MAWTSRTSSAHGTPFATVLISTAGMVVGDSLPDDAHRIYGIEFMLDEATMLSVVWGLKGRDDA